MSFFNRSSIIMGVILVIVLIIFAIMIYNSKYGVKFPPVNAECPDYWETIPKTDGTHGSLCFNNKNIGNSACENKIDFSGPMWTGVAGLCQKQKWASKCEQVWDGVTNVDNAC